MRPLMNRWMDFARRVDLVAYASRAEECASIGFAGAQRHGEREFEEIAEAYTTPKRFYHTLDEHIGFCIDRLDELFSGNIPLAAEGALWFHDACPSEDASAEMARRILKSMYAPHKLIHDVCALIEVTKHKAAPHVMLFGEDGRKRPYDYELDVQAGIVADIDLLILGTDDETFDNYEVTVAREYAHVDESIRRRVRGEILESILTRDVIYNHRKIREQYEAQARKNLARSIAKLRAV